MKIANAMAFARELLAQSYSPELDARLLLEHTLQANHAHLLAHGDEAISAENVSTYFAYVARAQALEPIPYIMGEAAFRHLELAVSPATLIPRPETEQLVDLVKRWIGNRAVRLVDIGTGSGCIAISLATELPHITVEAVDVSAEALAIAQANAKKYASAIQFHHGSLLQPVTQPVDAIVANLPYITDAEWTELDDAVKSYEPALALRGGQLGLDLIEQLLQQAQGKIRPNGAIFLEIGWQQGENCRKMARSYFPNAQIKLLPDYAQHNRFVVIET